MRTKFLTRTLCLLLSFSSCACSATTSNETIAPDTRVESGGRSELIANEDCKLASHECQPQQIAEAKVHAIEIEIIATSARVYESYLTDDPNYVKDIESYLQKSSEAWLRYRDAECEIEPYINGMSRREMSSIAEQCKLERTKLRISELEALLTTLKSNQE